MCNLDTYVPVLCTYTQGATAEMSFIIHKQHVSSLQGVK